MISQSTAPRKVASGNISYLCVKLPPESFNLCQRPGPVPRTAPCSKAGGSSKNHSNVGQQKGYQDFTAKNVTNAKLRHKVMSVTQPRLRNQTRDITEPQQLISAAVEDRSHCSGTLSIPMHHHQLQTRWIHQTESQREDHVKSEQQEREITNEFLKEKLR